MRQIETVHAEPLDSIESPNYRVNFWEPGHGWALDAYALAEVADLSEVLSWVEANARGRRFELFVEMNDDEPEGSFQTPRRSGLIRLLGSNPNRGEEVIVATFVKE